MPTSASKRMSTTNRPLVLMGTPTVRPIATRPDTCGIVVVVTVVGGTVVVATVVGGTVVGGTVVGGTVVGGTVVGGTVVGGTVVGGTVVGGTVVVGGSVVVVTVVGGTVVVVGEEPAVPRSAVTEGTSPFCAATSAAAAQV